MRMIVGVTGASGAVYGVRLLEELRNAGVETHLVISQWGARTIAYETDYTLDQVRKLAYRCYDNHDMAAPIASGGFCHDGMAIAPCSMKTLAAVACGFTDTLIARAADIALKERRRLVLVARETPLSAIHLQNMLTLAQSGAVLLPPAPAFYNRPQTIAELVDHTVCRLLDQLQISNQTARRWQGPPDTESEA